ATASVTSWTASLHTLSARSSVRYASLSPSTCRHGGNFGGRLLGRPGSRRARPVRTAGDRPGRARGARAEKKLLTRARRTRSVPGLTARAAGNRPEPGPGVVAG